MNRQQFIRTYEPIAKQLELSIELLERDSHEQKVMDDYISKRRKSIREFVNFYVKNQGVIIKPLEYFAIDIITAYLDSQDEYKPNC